MNPRYLLLGAAASMGAVAIWSMHFIGNRALIMAQGERHLQIQYNAGFTAGSFFLPICVLGIAFYLLGFSEKVNITQVIVVGFLTGAAVCGMHYFGQGGISNYLASYDWQYVLGSAFIAITAATLALGVFFYLNATWTDNWMKRALCAAVLAVSVSGMHWVATVGTTYRLKEGRRKANGLTRQATVVVVLCLVRISSKLTEAMLKRSNRPWDAALLSFPSPFSAKGSRIGPPVKLKKSCWLRSSLTTRES